MFLSRGINSRIGARGVVLSRGVAALIVTLTGLTDGEARPGATLGVTVPDGVTFASFAWTATGGGSGTSSTFVVPTGASGGSVSVQATDTQGRVWRGSAIVRYAAPVAAGALDDVTITEGNTDAIATAGDFTFLGTRLYSLTAAPAGMTINSGTGAIDASAVAVGASQSVVVRLADANDTSRFAQSGFSLTVEEAVAPVTPEITAVSYTAGGSGDRNSAQITVAYAGSDSLRYALVTGTDPMTVTPAQVVAGSGGTGTIEFTSGTFTLPDGPIVVSGFTSASNSANRIGVVIYEVNNGGVSAVEQITVSGLDFTPATVSAASVNVDGDTLTITWTEAVFGATTASPFTLTNADRANPTIGTFSGAGTDTWTAPLTGTAIVGGDTLSLAYVPGDLRDDKGNPVAAFSGQAVTNNVPSAVAFTPSYAGTAVAAAPAGLTTTITGIPIGDPHPDRWVYLSVITQIASDSDNAVSSVTINGEAATVIAGSDGDGTARNRTVLFIRSNAKVTAGTTATLVINWNVEPNTDKDVRAWSYSVLATNAPTLAASNSQHAVGTSMNVNTLAGDCVIAGIMTLNSVDPATGWTGVTHRNSDDLGNASPDEWAGVADTLVVASPSTPLTISHTITANRQLACVVLRETP